MKDREVQDNIGTNLCTGCGLLPLEVQPFLAMVKLPCEHNYHLLCFAATCSLGTVCRAPFCKKSIPTAWLCNLATQRHPTTPEIGLSNPLHDVDSVHDMKGKGKAANKNPLIEKGGELDTMNEGVDAGFHQMPSASMKTIEEGGDVSSKSEEDDFFVMVPHSRAMPAATDTDKTSQQTMASASASGETLKTNNKEDP